jgi:hypothetical protein
MRKMTPKEIRIFEENKKGEAMKNKVIQFNYADDP